MLSSGDSALRAPGHFALDTTQPCDMQRSGGRSLVMPDSERELTLVLWRVVKMAVASFCLASFSFTCDLHVSGASLETYFQS